MSLLMALSYTAALGYYMGQHADLTQMGTRTSEGTVHYELRIFGISDVRISRYSDPLPYLVHIVLEVLLHYSHAPTQSKSVASYDQLLPGSCYEAMLKMSI